MKKLFSFILLLMLCGCIGMEDTSQGALKTPEEALQKFFEYYSQEKRDELSKISPALDISNVLCHKLGFEEYSDPKINDIEYHGKFCNVGFEVEFYGVSIERYCSLFNNSGNWEVWRIEENEEEFEEIMLFFDTILANMHPLNDLEIIEPENIILLGESHWNREMPEFEFEFLKFLNENYGFRDVMVEWPRCRQYLTNAYLETGEPDITDDFLKNVYEYNRNLPPEKRIRVWHGDIDHSNTNEAMDLVIGYVSTVEDENTQNEIFDILKELPLKNVGENRAPFLAELGNASQKIRKVMEVQRDFFPEEGFDTVISILKSFEDNGRCYSLGDGGGKWSAEREKMMLKYFEESYEKSGGKILGIYGGYHVVKGKGRLGGYLSEKYKVLSVSMSGFKGTGKYEEYVSRPQEGMYILDEITLDKNFLIKSEFIGNEGVEWEIFFDTLHANY